MAPAAFHIFASLGDKRLSRLQKSVSRAGIASSEFSPDELILVNVWQGVNSGTATRSSWLPSAIV